MINSMKFLKDVEYVRTGGSKEELKAAKYIAEHLKGLGLKPTIESFKVQASTIQKATLEVVEPYKQKIDCLGYFCAGNCDKLTKELVYYTGDYTQYHNVKDKIVLIDSGLPYWTFKDLLDKGAAGYITCNGYLFDDNKDIDQKELRVALKEQGVLPGVEINIKDAFEMIQKGATKVSITLKQKESVAESRNVVCKIKGQDDQEIIFTAHYDSTPLSKGSYDNATGSIGILKCAEFFAKHTPKHSLTFVWCGSEERGLLGSKAYVEKHKKALDKIALCINLDMIGTALGGFLACVTGEEKLVDYIDYYSKINGFTTHAYQDVYSSDSTPFADKGIPAVSFARITNYSPIHCRYDELKMIHKETLEKDIDFIIKFSEVMANSEMIPVKRYMPDNMKEKIDVYLFRKEPKR